MIQLNSAEWRSLLRKFVADASELRLVLQVPFEQDGYVCATDTHVLIRVAKRYISDDYLTDRLTPNVAKVMPEYNPRFTISTDNLRGAFIQKNINYDVLTGYCPECNEECEVKWKYTDLDGDEHTMYAECPCCYGTGRIPNGINHYLEVGKCTVNAYFMLLLYHAMMKLGVNNAEVSIDNTRPVLFTLAEGVDIIIMPTNLEYKRHKSVSRVKLSKLRSDAHKSSKR